MEGFGITHRGKVRKENQDSFLMEIFDRAGARACALRRYGWSPGRKRCQQYGLETFMSHVRACLAEKLEKRP